MNILLSDLLIISAAVLMLYFFIFRKSLLQSHASSFEVPDNIPWWQLGLFILAANIGFDYLVAGAGMGYSKGLALGSYEWTGVIFMIPALLFILPKLMSPGIRTTPEYLAYRYGKSTRVIAATFMTLLHLVAALVPMFYATGEFLHSIYGAHAISWMLAIATITLIVLINTRFDFLIKLNTTLFIIMISSGIIVMVFAVIKVDGVSNIVAQANGRLNSILPSSDDMLPWHAVFLGGLWMAHAYYWCFNQFIVQSVLQSKSLSKAQFAYLLAGSVKLLVPFIILIPGIVVYVLYGESIGQVDQALTLTWQHIVPEQLSGILMIGYLTSVLTTTAAITYSTVSIIVNDLLPEKFSQEQAYKRNFRISLLLILTCCVLGGYFFKEFSEAPMFKYNQYIMNALTPALVAVFGMGLFVRFATTLSANIAFALSVPLYFLLQKLLPEANLLNIGGLVFILSCSLMLMLSKLFPQQAPRVVPDQRGFSFERNIGVVIWSIFLITIVTSIYIIF